MCEWIRKGVVLSGISDFEISTHVESPSSEKLTSYSGPGLNCEYLNYDEFKSVRVICNAFIDNYSPS